MSEVNHLKDLLIHMLPMAVNAADGAAQADGHHLKTMVLAVNTSIGDGQDEIHVFPAGCFCAECEAAFQRALARAFAHARAQQKRAAN